MNTIAIKLIFKIFEDIILGKIMKKVYVFLNLQLFRFFDWVIKNPNKFPTKLLTLSSFTLTFNWLDSNLNYERSLDGQIAYNTFSTNL